ncbi:MAG: redox-regulated ATPase YchF [Acidobacteria bacterium]|nr:redox-regulated ATPase YchF [Acidobacteriota bacterium]
MNIGIVGLGQAGKTTLFRTLTHTHGTGLRSGRPEAHVGVVHVPDARLDRLIQMFQPKKSVYASVEYVDMPGSVIELARAGAQSAALRDMDALAHVVRVFEDDALPPESGSVDPRRDIENVELELILSDLASVEKRLDRLDKDIKKQKNPALEKEHQVFQRLKQALEKQTPLRELAIAPDEEKIIRGFTFLSFKPMLYVLNLGEKDAAKTHASSELAKAYGLSQRAKTEFMAVCGKVEAELAEMTDDEAAEFLASYGLAESAVTRIIHSSYHLLGLISFFTVGEEECHAWTVRLGTTAVEAAGAVHSDLQKGFIRAEVIAYDDLIQAGGLAEARQHGTLRLEGKEYIVKDGEFVHIRHSG